MPLLSAPVAAEQPPGVGAVGREDGADRHVVGVVVVDAAADDEIAGEEMDVGVGVVLCGGWDAGGEQGERDGDGCACERTAAEAEMWLHGDS